MNINEFENLTGPVVIVPFPTEDTSPSSSDSLFDFMDHIMRIWRSRYVWELEIIIQYVPAEVIITQFVSF